MAGYPPIVKIEPLNPEVRKYHRMWSHPEYRKHSPGERNAMYFLQQVRPRKGARVIDFGCGTGRGAAMLAMLGGMKVTMVDFVDNCLDPEMAKACKTQPEIFEFVRADLEQKIPVVAEYGYCCDVMEHIPPDKVTKVLSNILHAARHVFFTVSTREDHCGGIIDTDLHLTVQPYEWWLQRFTDLGVMVHWSEKAENGNGCAFYVSGWTTGRDVVASGVLTEEEEQIKRNIHFNVRQGWDQIRLYPTNSTEVMILGGSPSLPQYLDEIKAKRAEGVKLITLNGAYNWALENGLTPSATVVVDARPFNARFVKPVIDSCKYFIASGCDPSVLEGLPKDRTYLYHVMPNISRDILNEYYGEGKWHAVPGGSTVLLRSISLFRMLGFTRFHLYGCDSCLSGDAHHAYPQPENDNKVVIPVLFPGSDRVFYCHAWMISQAQEFIDTIRGIGDIIEIAVYGDGLLAHILNTAAAQGDPA
jgi:SAM-dependent methyltransferase